MAFAVRRLPAAPPLELWLVDLDRGTAGGAAEETAGDDLDEKERARAARFAFDRDRRRWTAARGALRHLLGLHTGTPAGRLRFDEGEFGKPHLANHPGCAFSLSHSEGFALVAIAAATSAADRADVGVDLEVPRPLPDLPELAERCFTREERRQLERTPARERARRFLSGWTRKEACLKALGYGLQVEPSSFAVGLPEPGGHGDDAGADERTLLIDTPTGMKSVTVASLELPGSLVGALARVRVCPPMGGVRK